MVNTAVTIATDLGIEGGERERGGEKEREREREKENVITM